MKRIPVGRFRWFLPNAGHKAEGLFNADLNNYGTVIKKKLQRVVIR